MRYLRNLHTDPYFNMAFDEYALERLALEEPLFYLWQNRPSVIIGLNQNAYAEVCLDYLHEQDIALVRRVTGGGAVYHDLGNLNYTIVGRTADLNCDYPEYARHILKALQSLGVDAELSGRNDILVDGHKVSGYAKRVYKDRLMVHGTLMYDVDLERLTQVLNPSAEKLTAKGIASVRSRVTNLRHHLPSIPDIDSFRKHLEEYLSRGYKDAEYILQQSQLEEIGHIAQNKFNTYDWIYGRSPQSTIVRSARFACGHIEVCLHVSEGHIAQCHISGDFMGNLPASEVEQCLVGVRYDRTAIHDRLFPLDIGMYFDHLSADDFIRLVC